MNKNKVRCPHCGEVATDFWDYYDVVDIDYDENDFYKKVAYCCSHCDECFNAYLHYTMQYQGCTVVGE